MSGSRTLVALPALMMLVMPPIAAGEETPELTFTSSVNILSKYVFRGVVISGDPVLHHDMSWHYGHFGFGVWNNIHLTDYEVAPWRVTKTDWGCAYHFPLPKTDLSVGYDYYTYPNLHVDDTQEVYANADFDVLLSPTLAVVHDVDETGGLYANASVAHAFSTGFESGGENVIAGLGASLGYGDSDYISGHFDHTGPGFVDLVLSCTLAARLEPNIALTGVLRYMQLLDDDLRECTDKSDALYGGVGITIVF